MSEHEYTDATAGRYAGMTDAKLLEFAVDFNELTDAAKELLREEFQRRGLTLPAPKPEAVKLPHKLVAEPGFIPEPEENDENDFEAEEAAERALQTPRNLVTVRRFRDLSEAIVARAVLEQNGIACFLRDEHTIRMDWLWSNFIGGARLQVADDDAAMADEILSQPIPSEFAVDAGQTYKQPVCPKCGSLDVIENDDDRKFRAASMLFSPATLLTTLPAVLMRGDVWKCNVCGTRWTDNDELPAST